MLNLSEIHPDVRKTLHEIENAMVRDISPNTPQAGVGQKIKDIYAKSTFIRMFSPVDSTLKQKKDEEGKLVYSDENKKKPVYVRNNDGGMKFVSIMGGELAKDDNGNFVNADGFRDMYDMGRWDTLNATNTRDGKLADRYRPIPGVTSITVDFAGSMKAIRNATISWTCFSFEDISRLTPHFLSHGKPIVLEWGFSSLRDLSDIRFMDIDAISNGEAYKQIQEQIWSLKGKYDAMAGLIKNFEWKTREDGGFDCTTEITSLGVNTLGQEIKGSTTSKQSSDESDEEKPKSRTIPTFPEFMNQLEKEVQALCSSGKWFGNSFLPPEEQPNGLIAFEAQKWYGDTKFGPYISWGWMEDNIISKFLGKINTSGGSNPEERVFSDFRSIIPKMKDGIPQLDDFESVLISNHESLITADPTEFIFPGQWPLTANGDDDWGGDSEKILKFYNMLIERKDVFPDFAHPEDVNKGRIRNILIHFDVIVKAFKDVLTIEAGMTNLFNKLNERYGIWNLKITTSNTGKDGRCSVIDEHYTHHSVKELIENPSTYDGSKVDGLLYIFNVMNERSIVKTHNLTAKLPSSMQTAAMFGANTSGEAPSTAGNPGAIRLGKLSGQTKDESIGDMKMAWERLNFGSENPEDPNANTGELTLDSGPEIAIKPSEEAEKDKEDDNSEDEALKAKNAALRAAFEQEEKERVFVTALKARNGGGKKAEVLNFGDESKPVFEIDEDDRKMYNQFGVLKTKGTINYQEIMKAVLTTGEGSSNSRRDILVPLEIDIEVTGIGGIVPGNAFLTSYLPEMYDDLVCFQATNISHNIGTDGWVTGIKGLMRCASTSDTEAIQLSEEQKIKIIQNENYEKSLTKAEKMKALGLPLPPGALSPPSDDGFVGPKLPQPRDPDPEEEKKKEADKLKAERDAANRKAKQDEERKRKEAERKQKEKEKQEPKRRDKDGNEEITQPRRWGYDKVKLKRIEPAGGSPRASWEATVVIFNTENRTERAEGKARVFFQDGYTTGDLRARQQASVEAKQNAKTLAVATFRN